MNRKLLVSITTLLLLLSLLLTGCGEAITTVLESTTEPTSSTTSPTDSTTTAPTTTTTAPTTTTDPVTTTDPTPTGVELPTRASDEVGVMTFNLRYDVTSNDYMALSVRGPHLMELIDKYDPDSIGFNEATANWMSWLRSRMADRGYAYVGVGRDTATDATSSKADSNEYSPVFYKVDKFDLIDSGTFWLSKTPATPKTKGWGSGYNRICTYAVLRNKTTGETYAHFSTHLCFNEAQENSVFVIESYIRAVLEKHGNIGVVLSGDFNNYAFKTDDPDFKATTYNRTSAFLDDTRYLAQKLGVVGATYMGYNAEKLEEAYLADPNKPFINTEASPIDYIFVKKNAYECSYYTVVNDSFTFELNGKTWHNHPVSDHYGVYAIIKCVSPETPFTKDDTKLVDHKATVSTTLPDGLLPKLTEGISISSTFGAVNDKNAITNLLKDDDSTAMITVSGDIHGYWEITLSAPSDSNIRFSGLSITTAKANMPRSLKVFVSRNGTDWEQVGSSYDKTLTGNTTYYLKTDEVIVTHYVKLIFTDTPTLSKLSNITLYAEQISNGLIKADQITVTAGPNYKHSQGEGCEKLFDGQTKTKFYCRQYSESSVPATPDDLEAIYFQTATPVTITHYNMINANDTASFKGRLPRKWTLYGSLDGENWTEIDCKTNPSLSTGNYDVNSFTVNSPGSYQYYKLVFVVGTTGNVQFSEMQLFEDVK